MKCSICQGELSGFEIRRCPQCKNEFHIDCWDENGGCGTPGCEFLPHKAVKSEQQYEQTSYWGAATKVCPACGEEIEVNTISCPHCKEVFDTIDPVSRDTYKESKSIRRYNKPSTHPIAITIFICGLIGCTAPINLIAGGIWFFKNVGTLKTEYPQGYFLAMAGLILSALYTFVMIIVFFSNFI
ncbi:MAG TPA: hypothetical protein VF941_09015 [Clostridia bacterium]